MTRPANRQDFFAAITRAEARPNNKQLREEAKTAKIALGKIREGHSCPSCSGVIRHKPNNKQAVSQVDAIANHKDHCPAPCHHFDPPITELTTEAGRALCSEGGDFEGDLCDRILAIEIEAYAAGAAAARERLRQRFSASLDGPPEYSTAVWLSTVFAILDAPAEEES